MHKIFNILFFIIFLFGFSIDSKFNLNNIEHEIILLQNIRITAYNNISNQTDDSPNIMASNRLVYEGAIAISRDLKNKYKIKYGDIIYIEKFKKYYIIEDVMNKRYNNSIDIFMFNYKEAIKFGVKKSNIKIYKIKR